MVTGGGRGGRAVRIAAVWIGVLAATACAPARVAPAGAERWVGTWSAAPQLVEPRNMPPTSLGGNTLRQHLHVSLGGSQVRLRFSNEFGNDSLTLDAVQIARAAGLGAAQPGTSVPLSFQGQRGVTIAPGQRVLSDPLIYEVPALSQLVVTIHFGAVPSNLTGHPGSRTTSFIAQGRHVSIELPAATKVERWYVLSGLEVIGPPARAAVVTLGNSITDGRGSVTDMNNRWPDNLARRLQKDARTTHIAVLNAGIGGNCVVRACLGPAAVDRLDRDVLDQAGARWLIVLEGVNDIGNAAGAEASGNVARDLIAAYQKIIERARARGLRVYGATILPFGGSQYDSPDREQARQTVNQWIKSNGAFDAVIDFDAALRDPSNPSRLFPAADTGDHLHPNELGYRMMADAIDLRLFLR